MMKKQLILSVICALALSSSISAGIQYSLDDFSNNATYAGVDYVQIGDDSIAKTSISPDFSWKNFSLGIDINIYMPSDLANKYNLDWVNLRHIAYDKDNRYGFKWGRLKNLTLGYGLLMSNYDSGAGSTTQFVTKQAGFLGYTTFNTPFVPFDASTKITGLYTGTNVSGGRIKTTLNTAIPLSIGATYLNDSDGIDDTYQNERIFRKSQSGYSVDMAIALAGDFLVPYVEYAELNDHGNGTSAGIKGDIFSKVSYQAAYRRIGAGFVPGYFNTTYEATGFNFATDAQKEEVTGFLASLNTQFYRDILKAGVVYETYDDNSLLSAAFGWSNILNTSAVINYSVPYQGDENATLQTDILYKTNSGFDYVYSIKRTYLTDSTYTESYSGGVRVNLSNRFPKFNFGS